MVNGVFSVVMYAKLLSFNRLRISFFRFLAEFLIDNVYIIAIICTMNSNNSISNNKNMFKTISSKSALLITLAVSLIALAALAVWAQAAQAQSSVVSVSVSQDYGEDSGGSDITVALRASGSNDFVPAGNGTGEYGQYEVRTVENTADCNEDDFGDGTAFGIADSRFEVKRSRDTSYTRSSVRQTFTTGTVVEEDNILVRAGANADHDEMYICVEATYSDGDDDIVEYAVSSTMLDLANPMVDDVVVNDDDRNQEYGLGENIDIEVEFDERVYVRKVTDSSNSDAALPYIDNALGTNKDAELRSTASGATLTFRYTVEFLDSNGAIGDLDDFTINLPDGDDDASDPDYVITDAAGNMLAVDNPIDEEVDFRGGEILIELTVRAKRMGDRLVVEAMPDMYEDADDDDMDTVASAVVWVSEDAPDVRGNEDPCKDGIMEAEDASSDAASDQDDYLGVDLPSDGPDGEYYCFAVTDSSNSSPARVTYTNVYRYADDNTAPRIGFAYENNVLTITPSDPESGIDESSLKWFWSEIAADNVNKACNSRTGESEFNHDGEDGMIEITIKASYSGDKICVRVENGEGDQSIVEQPLSYVDPGTPDPGTPDPGTPDPGTPDPGTPDPGTPDPGTTPGTGTVKVPKTWPGQAVWDSWTTEKVTMNPWGCLDTTKIRGDNGQCISGGTSLTDGDYVYVNSPADAGSSSTTTAPGPGTTTPPTTPDPGTTTPPTTPDPGTTTPPTTPDPTTTPDPDPETVDAGTITLNYDYAESMTTVEVSFDAKLTNVRYVVQEESGQCTPAGVAAATPMDVADDAIEVTEEDATNGRYVCVFATSSELGEDDAPIVVYQPQQVGEDATSGDDEETPPADDEDGGNGIWIIVGIVAVAIVGVVVVLVFLGKRNQ